MVTSRSAAGLRTWTNWLQEDSGSGTYPWLRADIVPRLPLLVIEDKEAKSARILVEPHLMNAEFVKLGCRISGGLVTLSSRSTSSWTLLFPSFLGSLSLTCLGLLVLNPLRWPKLGGPLFGGLDGWAWNEVKALPPAQFSGLAVLFSMVESTGVWPQGPIDVHIAMIPEVDDSTSLGQLPHCVLLVIYRLWASLRLTHLKYLAKGLGPSICL